MPDNNKNEFSFVTHKVDDLISYVDEIDGVNLQVDYNGAAKRLISHMGISFSADGTPVTVSGDLSQGDINYILDNLSVPTDAPYVE